MKMNTTVFELTPEQNARLADFLLMLDRDGGVPEPDQEAKLPEPPLSKPELEEPADPHEPLHPEPKVTLEQLRGLCANKSAAGHGAAVRALMQERGANKLSAVSPEHWDSLYAEVESLK